ncbi:MAG: ComF family protein [Hyphomicrobiaceae bacterium]
MSAFALTQWLDLAARAASDVIVPPVCLACHARIESPDSLCGACWRNVTFIRAPLCDRLGIPLPFGGGMDTLVSAAATAHPPPWARARAVAVYEPQGVVAGLIHAMKYADRHDGRRMMARWLAEAGRELLAEAELIVPVPLTRRRLVQRQFNQSALLAREVQSLTGVPWSPSALVKTRETPAQVTLSGSARRDNMKGAFTVPPRGRAQVSGRRIVLLDDVVTTGATAEAATRALLAAGAARVDILAVARVASPGLEAP